MSIDSGTMNRGDGGGKKIFVVLAYARLVFSYLIFQPVKWVALQAVPWTAVTLYSVLLYIFQAIIWITRMVLFPVLYPLEMLVWKPVLAVLMLVYRLRYLIYFTSSAVILGAIVGLASWWLVSRTSTSSSNKQPTKAQRNNQKKRESHRRMKASNTGTARTKIERDSPPPYSSITDDLRRPSPISPSSSIQPRKLNALKPEHMLPHSLAAENDVRGNTSSHKRPTSGGKETSLSSKSGDSDRYNEAMKSLSRRRKQARFSA